MASRMSRVREEREEDIRSAVESLRLKGYAVIPNVVSEEEAQQLDSDLWAYLSARTKGESYKKGEERRREGKRREKKRRESRQEVGRRRRDIEVWGLLSSGEESRSVERRDEGRKEQRISVKRCSFFLSLQYFQSISRVLCSLRLVHIMVLIHLLLFFSKGRKMNVSLPTSKGIILHNEVSHCKAAWDARLLCLPYFARIYGTGDLFCSQDRVNVMPGYSQLDGKRWWHADQARKNSELACVQGYLDLFGTDENCGGLMVAEKSHLDFQELLAEAPCSNSKGMERRKGYQLV